MWEKKYLQAEGEELASKKKEMLGQAVKQVVVTPEMGNRQNSATGCGDSR